jgi:hypothetical protein
VTLLASASAADTECVIIREWDEVFTGRVTRKTEVAQGVYEIAFDVSRVWNGKTSKTAILYQTPTINNLHLVEGEEYAIFAMRPDKKRRAQLGPTAPEKALEIPPCNGAVRDNEESMRKRFGKGREPTNDGALGCEAR